jgi:ABC-type phosphate transport system substrate-binding protein
VNSKTNILLLIITLGVCLLSGVGGQAAQVAVIAHPSVPEDSLDKDRLYDVYKGDVRSWEDGTKIKLWDLGERCEIRDSFYDFIGKRPSRMKSIWMRKLLTGEGGPPDISESQDDMLKNVIKAPGSIGYVDLKLVDDRVKLLLVIGDE